MRRLLLFAAAAAAADPSCASLDDVSAALATLPSVVKPPQRRSEMTSQLRLLTEPPLPGLRSRCFRQGTANASREQRVLLQFSFLAGGADARRLPGNIRFMASPDVAAGGVRVRDLLPVRGR